MNYIVQIALEVHHSHSVADDSLVTSLTYRLRDVLAQKSFTFNAGSETEFTTGDVILVSVRKVIE